mmetsp:Transcript_44426/g.96578  ORF Transcript_44426/g.96578 Transcript_44426/m.96578 type:complete len:369 (-) Transcript_44426:199-1305(-)
MAVVVESHFEKHKVSAQWHIKGLSFLTTQVDKKIDSGEMLEILGCKYGLEFYWGSHNSEETVDARPYCSVYCRRLGQLPETARFSFEISLISQQSGADFRVKSQTMGSSIKNKMSRYTRGWPCFKKRSKILDSRFVLDDRIILQLAIEVWPGTPHTKRLRPAATTASFITEGESMQAEFRELLRSGEGSDITLSCDGSDVASSEQHFRVHRLILSMRSPVFKRMLSSGMQESEPEATVKLPGIDSRVLGWLLDFIYTDEVDDEACVDDEALCHLLAAAHLYEVRTLVRKCAVRVATQLSEEVAAERLMMADRLGLDDLRSDILDFICHSDERLCKIQDSEGFLRLRDKQPQLAFDILSRRFSKKIRRS